MTWNRRRKKRTLSAAGRRKIAAAQKLRWAKVRRERATKAMIISDRLRVLREHKKLSRCDIEKRTGLFRCYISRVE